MSDSPDPVFQQLAGVREGLLRLHKAMLDRQKKIFELEHGRVASANELLQLVIYNPQFDWLHKLSELVVEIDQATDAREPMTGPAASALLDQSRTLLSNQNDTFGEKLHQAIAQDGDVAQAHLQVIRLLKK
jgi:hypothetical protein